MNDYIQPRKAFLWVAIITILYVLRDILTLPVPSIIFTGVCLLAFVFTDLQESMSVLVFTSVLTLPGNEIRLIYILLYFIKKRMKLNKLTLADGGIIILMILELFNAFIFSAGSIGDIIYKYVTFVLFLIIPIIWIRTKSNSKELVDAIKYFVFGIVLVGLITIYMTVKLRGWAVLISGTNSLGMDLGDYITASSMTTSFNRNTLGILACVGVALSMILLDQRYIKRLFGISAIAVCMFVILTTRSRTAFLLVAIILAYWVLLVAFRKGQGIKGIIMVAAIVAGILLLKNYLPDAWNAVINRFINQTDITNGRTSLNTEYLQMWKSNIRSILFGYGATSYNDYLHISNSPHNMVVDILICWGITGVVLLGIWLFKLFMWSLKNVEKEKCTIAILPSFVMLVGLMMGQYLTVPTGHLYLCFLILCINVFKNDTNRNEKAQV